MSLNQVTNIQDGNETFELWSTEDGSTWEIRKPEPSQGDPAYSAYGILGSGGEGLDLTSPRVVVRNNIYVNNYNNSDLSVNAKNQALELLQSRSGFTNIADGSGDNKAGISTSTDDNDNDNGFNASFEFPEFGRVDKILQQLSLRNLKYPIDADYGNTQDYMQINQFSYKSPQEGIFFPEEGMPQGFSQGAKILLEGVPSGSPKEKAIGLVKLPMPNSLADSNNVSWGPDQLNAITAAATSAAMGTTGDALEAIINFAQTAGGRNIPQNIAEATTKINQGIGNVISAFGNAAGELKDADKRNINILGRTVLGSALLNAITLQVSPESILSRGAGVIPNSNLALLFNAPTLREFTFSWKMSPRSREEATRINNILRFFKQGMAPKKSNKSKSGGASYFLGAPNVFDLHFKTAKTKNYEILDRNDSVVRIKTCACTGAAVNYTPEGMWNAYEKGQPVSITLTLRFNELEPIFDTDYDNNYFNYDPQRTDLLPVPTDAVGY